MVHIRDAICIWVDSVEQYIFFCECLFLRCTQGPLASSMVDQFTKGQLFSELWLLTELELPSNQKKSARKHVQETTEIS